MASTSKLYINVFGIIWSIIPGMFYSFAVFFDDIKGVLGLSQTEINAIAASAYLSSQNLNFTCSLLTGKFGRRVMFAAIFLFISAVGVFGIMITLKFELGFIGMLSSMMVFGWGCISSFVAMLPVLLGYCDTEKGSTMYSNGVLVTFAIGGAVGTVLYLFLPGSTKGRLEMFMLVFGSLLVILSLLTYATVSERQTTGSDNENEKLLEAQPIKKRKMSTLWGSARFWGIFVIVFVIVGVSANYYNNAGSVLSTMRASHYETTMILVIFNVAQTVGRVIVAFTTYSKEGEQKYESALSHLAIFSLLIAIASIGSAIHNSVTWMYSYISIVGLVYGSNWSLFSLLGFAWKEDIFPLIQVPGELMYGILSYAPGCGPLLFDLLCGAMYDAKANSDKQCYGSHCYRLYFYISGGLCCVSVAISLFMKGKHKQTQYTCKQ